MTRVLIVDDSPTFLALMALLLSRFQTKTASDWKVASALAHDWRPDVIVIDEHLEAFRGSFLIRALRMFIDPDVKIISISADEKAAQDALSAGADLFISKASLEGLPELVEKLTSKRSGPTH